MVWELLGSLGQPPRIPKTYTHAHTYTYTTPLQIMKLLEMPDLSCHSYDSGKMFSGTPEGEKKGRGVLNRTGEVEDKRMNES